MTDITDHLADIFERVAHAIEHAKRNADSVTIVAVSKQQDAAAIAAAHRAGVQHFGESYVQEALPKIAALADLKLTWHFIGQLQANKTRAVAEHFAWVHTVDRIKVAERLDAQRPPSAPPLNVLIQVNQGDQSGKGGIAPSGAAELARQIMSLPRLHLRGLMTLPPQGDGDATVWFSRLAELERQLVAEGIPLDTLSMGMSADFEAAIHAGADFVRIGTAIFGRRSPA